MTGHDNLRSRSISIKEDGPDFGHGQTWRLGLDLCGTEYKIRTLNSVNLSYWISCMPEPTIIILQGLVLLYIFWEN